MGPQRPRDPAGVRGSGGGNNNNTASDLSDPGSNMSIATTLLARSRRAAVRSRDAVRGAVYARRLRRLLASRDVAGADPRTAFGDASDGFWLWLHTEGYRRSPAVRAVLPPLPDEAVQLRFTGQSGDDTLDQAFHAYRAFRDLGRRALGTIKPDASVVDFGCGWGRIARFFEKDVDRERVHGIDCSPEAIEVCRQLDRWARYELVDPLPPTPIPAASVDLVYCYSVFSHLSEAAHMRWVSEFARVLRPGGALVVTTRKRDFITYCAELRARPDLPFYQAGLRDSFTDTAAALRDYDAGRFCYAPVGGGGVLDSSFYGEACIPRRYVEDRWAAEFELVDFVEDVKHVDQNVIAVRRR